MYKVYAVGVMQVDLSRADKFPSDRKSRLWFFFANFEDAEKCVLENQSDIFEYYYNIALIEEHYVHDPNDPAPPEIGVIAKQWWYEAQYPTDEKTGESLPLIISKIETPQIFRNIVNFWAG